MTALPSAYTWRTLGRDEFPLVKDLLRATIESESYFTLYGDAPDEDLFTYWYGGLDNEVWVLEEEGVILGSFYQRSNHFGLGKHIANGGYAVSPAGRGKGIGRILGEKSLQRAKERGFRGMQFNFVVSTNTVAVNLWKSLGFTVVGVLPKAYHFQRERYVDAFVMFKDLTI
ncbi:MAG: GNAT family N-acetyltransferase [Alphaproteobacteria bacterium]|nr:GNAT family N-acetyltransferase [Alphaproteobacteria bacterium]